VTPPAPTGSTWTGWTCRPTRKPPTGPCSPTSTPVNQVAPLGSRRYFQWATRDRFVTPEVRAAFAAADPAGKVSLYDNAQHDLTEPAQADRVAWLAGELGLPA
jgi:hypothetical protein